MNANERLESLQQRYQSNFAGHPRISRSLTLLNEMIAEAQALLGEASAPLSASIEAELALYRAEAAAISEAQSRGEVIAEAHHAAAMAEQVFARYRRHFAGQDRRTRDLGILAEMIEDLEALDGQLKGADDPRIKETLGHIERYLDLFRRERQAIAQLRIEGPLSEQSALLAQLANGQLYIYRDHFAGAARLSRRPARLSRVILELEAILERMRALASQGFHSDAHRANIELLTERRGAYLKELDLIREAKAASTFEGLVNALGEAANALFEGYREGFAGQSRQSRDLARLDVICEGLYLLARQMDDLDRLREDKINHQNLQIVLDHLRLYGKEREAIIAAQRPQDG
ncbi:hypothetical protein KKF91_21030 [Myxococcota bacterium]|nr:hypothetical protein [Myxococcota bacterium]MBU1433028.1 hypothetical protein [Myxococcota bacterium]MBU1899937.1 hypothetical protein [Myxococcota bacterium]